MERPDTVAIFDLAKFCQSANHSSMGRINISLSGEIRSFLEEQVAARGFGTSSEYVRELIRKDRERQHMRGLLLEGAASAAAAAADGRFFKELRARVRLSPPRPSTGSGRGNT
mgnify:CR=1 FL=1